MQKGPRLTRYDQLSNSQIPQVTAHENQSGKNASNSVNGSV